jgi:proline iminopeptidase
MTTSSWQPARQVPLITSVLNDRRAGLVITVASGLLAGTIIALLMPRGPITTLHVITVMLAGLLVGFLSGFTMQSRWAKLLAPLAYIVAFELGTMNTVGPTMDTIRFDNTFGILALILGRGVHGLFALFPMLVGAAWGTFFARRHAAQERPAERGTRFYLRRAILIVATLAVALMAVLALWPASTPAFTGPDGKPLEGSIATLEKVRIGGTDQWIMIRGQDADNPVLLYLSGGPGQSDLAFPRVLFEDLTADVTIVGWDQRGTGKSYPAIEPTSAVTLDRAVADTIELAEYLTQRFDEQKIYVLGESWGTILGIHAVQKRPDLFHAYIGSGQMVAPLETDTRIRADLIDYATREGRQDILDTMEKYGTPPYKDVLAYAYVATHYDAMAGAYSPPPAYEERGTSSGVGPWGVLSSEYSLIDKVNVLRGLLDVFAILYPQIQEVDFRRDAAVLAVPVYILDGQHELDGRRDLALEWFEQLDAPIKEFHSFPNAGHAVAFEQFEAFHQILVEVILPQTYQQ